jgi:mannose-1-phosphate guanylyltransferase/phosphomannomutase
MGRERLTITLDGELLKEIDATVDGVNIRNRSHAIERLLGMMLSQKAPDKALILAGGDLARTPDGSRVPKAMVEVKGSPILKYVIRELSRNKVTDIIIAAGEGSEIITNYFGDGSLFGVKINYIIEEKRRGTEGALQLAKGLMGMEPFYVVNGDNIFRLNFAEMYKQHIATKALVTMALTTAEKTLGFGVTKLDGSRIVDFSEKPVAGKDKLVSTGIYIFDHTVLGMLRSSSVPIMLETSLFPRLAESGKLYGYVFSSIWEPFVTGDVEKGTRRMEKALEGE